MARFYDVAADVGLAATGLAGGSVVEDFDGDGYLDVMASSWGVKDTLRVFGNQRDGTFVERTAEAGLEGLTGGLNLIHADYDNDGDMQTCSCCAAPGRRRYGQPSEFASAQRRRRHFEDVTERSGVLSFHPTQTATWGDYDNDGWLDLFVGNEIEGPASSIRASSTTATVTDENGDGTFTDVAAEAGVDHGGLRQGRHVGRLRQRRTARPLPVPLRGPNVLFHNDGPTTNGTTFTALRDVGEAAGVSRSPARTASSDLVLRLRQRRLARPLRGGLRSPELRRRAGLPVGRGLPRSAGRRALPRLYRNRGDGTFEDVTAATRPRLDARSWAANFGDLDNDGFLDLYFGTGEPDYRSLVPNRMFRNDGGRTLPGRDRLGGFGHLQKGHGISFGDVDNDGDQDVFAVMGGAFSGDVFQNALFANPGHGNAWVTLRLEALREGAEASVEELERLDMPHVPSEDHHHE